MFRSSSDSLVNHNPHELVPFLEMQGFRSSPESSSSNISTTRNVNSSRRLLSTHISYQLLGKTLDSSSCRVVYITRNPKDTLVSFWHFTNKRNDAEIGPWPIEDAAEKFCSGIIPTGPYYGHVMGYKLASLEKPEKIFFITYEELMEDTKTHVKKLAEFLGCPFDQEEDVEDVVKRCSFDTIKNHEVNKSDDGFSWYPVPYSSFFRQGIIGDHKNYLDSKSIERIDALTREKFHGAGLMYGI